MEWIDWLITAVLSLITFSIGASLKMEDFNRVFALPKALIWGLVLQMIFLPIFAFFIIAYSDMSLAFKVGLFIVAICPGGTTSNFVSYIVKADAALAISLTAINSFLVLITIPLFTNLALGYFMNDAETITLHFWDTFLHVLVILLLPAMLGLYFHRHLPHIALRMKQVLKYLNVVLLFFVFLVKFFAGTDNGGSGITQAEIWVLLPDTLLLHLGAMFISYYVARLILHNNSQATTIAIEVGLQNTALAVYIAGTILGENEMTKPALVYAIFSFFTTMLFAVVASKGYLMPRLKK